MNSKVFTLKPHLIGNIISKETNIEENLSSNSENRIKAE